MKLLKNGFILKNNQKIKKDVLVDKNKIIIEDEINENVEIIDCSGKLILPGFIDVHVHLREPGLEYKETIESGTLAAARGGFTTIMPMPNLNPIPDTIESLNIQLNAIKKDAKVRVLPYCSITKGLKGNELSDMEQLSSFPIFAFSDDGVGVQDAKMMYEAMKKASSLNKAIVAHCEENSLIYSGSAHEGKRNKELGIKGIPSICEAVQIARDVLLAEAANAHYHVCHVSSKESLRVIKDAKKAGINVTCEVTPHHLISCEDDIPSDNGLWKMNPPLRSKEDQEALIQGIIDGTIDCIATDHAPHSNEEKDCSFEKAKFGIIGLEHAFALLYTNLVLKNIITLQQLVDLLTIKPSNTFGLNLGNYENSDLVVVDLEKEYEINRKDCVSKSSNTPYEGKKVYGMPLLTIYNGEIVWEEKNA